MLHGSNRSSFHGALYFEAPEAVYAHRIYLVRSHLFTLLACPDRKGVRPMSAILLADNVIDRLRRRYPAYHETAYLFILSALHYSIERLGEPRHISGRELAEGCRDLALQRWGLMARSVLEYWGISTTRDLGEIVFALVELGVLVKQEEDTIESFEGVFDFEEAFDAAYPWPGVTPA